MRIEVYQCRFTGAIFQKKDVKKYIAHLAALRKSKARDRAYMRIRSTWESWLAEEKKKITHVDMIVPWFIANQKTIMDAVSAGIQPMYGYNHDGKFYDTDSFESISLTATYERNVSNSHACPDNGVTNWCAKDSNKPTGYPGWYGRIEGKLKRLKKHNGNYPYSSALALVGLKTGTGGGGNENWRYEVRLFLADWPGLKEQVREMEADVIVRKLKGEMVRV